MSKHTTEPTEQRKLKDFQGEQGSGGSYGTGGGFEDDGASVPAQDDESSRNWSASRVRSSAAKDRPGVQGDFGPDVGPDGEPVQGPPNKEGDAQHGYSQDSGYAQSGGTKRPAPSKT